jgi:hypothetical protein
MVMPVPVAVAAVARLIASKGVREAVKKYGKKAVDEAKKHVDDFKTKPTPGQKKINPVTKSQRANRETLRRSAGTGAVVGGAAALGAKALTEGDKPKAKAKPKKSSTPSGPPKAKAKPKSTPSGPPKAKKKAEKGTRVVGDKTGVKVYKDGKLVSNRKKKK